MLSAMLDKQVIVSHYDGFHLHVDGLVQEDVTTNVNVTYFLH